MSPNNRFSKYFDVTKIELFCAFFFFTSFLFSQEQNLYHFTTDQGLPSNETYDIYQDTKGYIWIATDRGLSKYDGYNFKNYTTDHNLGDNTIFKFYEDCFGRVWFLSYNGKLSYYYNDQIFQPKTNLKHTAIGHLLSMYVDKHETIWIGSSLGEFKAQFIHQDSLSISPTKEQYTLRQIDSNGYIYSGSYYRKKIKPRLFKNAFNIKLIDKHFYLIFLLTKKGKLKTNTSSDIIDSSYRRVNGVTRKWLLNNEILFYSNSGSSLNFFDSKKKKFKSIKVSGENQFSSIPIIKNKNGFAFSDTNNRKFYPIDLDSISISYGENTRTSITNIVTDSQNGIWTATLNSGIYYQPQSFIKTISNKHYNYEAIKELNGIEHLVLRTRESDILQYTKNRFEKIVDQPYNTVDGRLTSFRNKVVFYCIKNNGLKYLKGKRKVRLNDTIFPIRDAVTLNKEHYTLYNRLFVYMLGKNDSILLFKKFYSKNMNLMIRKIKSISYKNKSALYIGTLEGLIELHQSGKVIDLREENPLFKTRIETIQRDKYGRNWVATKGKGVLLLHNGTVTNITTSQGLLGSICTQLYIGKKRVWVATENGLSGINLENINDIDNFTKKDGLISNQINAIYELNNKVWVASDIGISYFDIEYHKKKYVPRVYIKDILVENQLKNKDDFCIAPEENLLTINFLGISLRDHGDLIYQYRLRGLDSNWYTTKNPSVQYSTLPKGNYVFEVKTINHQGISSFSQTIQFSKKPHFWETITFSIVIVILTILGTIFFVNHRLYIVKKRESLKRRAIQAELKLLRSQMNPHFTFNAMNSIQYYIQQNNTSKALAFVHKFSKLIRLILQNTQKETITLYEEIEALTLYMNIEQERLKNNFQYTINISKNVDQNQVKMAPMLLQPYVENAIWHGIMNKPNGKGKINIRIYEKYSRIICEIIDDGIGREASKRLQNNLKNSIGMSLLEERLSLINTSKVIKQTVEIFDILNSKKEICGTKVKLTL